MVLPTGPEGTASFGRMAGVAAIAAFFVGIVSGALFLAAADLDVRAFFEPARLLSSAASSRATLLHSGAITDLLSYYLPLIPLFL